MNNKLYMMIGLPASGKTTIAKNIAQKENATIISYDDIRKDVFKDERSKDDSNFIFRVIEERINEGLIKGNVIYDARNIEYKKRKHLLSIFTNVQKIAILVVTPFEECLKRNEKRFNVISNENIKKMYYNIYIPQKYEGFDEIQIVYNFDIENKEYNIKELMDNLDIPQDNPHHTLTIKWHCLKAYEYVLENYKDDEILSYATFLHDIGKKDTKTFKNKNGEETSIAHYYDHQNVGAYLVLFYLNNIQKDKLLEVCKLIQWHMLVDSNLSEKTKEKYKKLLGEKSWSNLEILHEADVSAK